MVASFAHETLVVKVVNDDRKDCLEEQAEHDEVPQQSPLAHPVLDPILSLDVQDSVDGNEAAPDDVPGEVDAASEGNHVAEWTSEEALQGDLQDEDSGREG